jgi:ligand-binding sensor domain-containing protein/two-component sensor histidine kinase
MERNGFKFALGLFFKPAFALVYALVISWPVFSQNVDHLTIEKVQDEGLTNNYINCILQDKNGFIWVGTGEGVFRYNGYSFKAFRNFPGHATTLDNNRITALYTENDNLWIGTGSGLSCIDINTEIVKNFTLGKAQQISAIFSKDDSVFWLATLTGLYQFNKNNHRWKLIPGIGRNSVSNISDDHKGHLYVTSSNGFYSYTNTTGEFKFHRLDFLPTYPKREKNITLSLGKTVIDKDGNLWICTWDAGLARYNPNTGKTDTWFHPTDDVRFLPYKIVMDILPDSSGNLWLANKEGGLTIFNPAKNKFINYPVEWKSETKISDPVLSLFRDRSGIVWIGTENGIFKYDPHHVSLAKTDLFLKTGAGLVPAHTAPLTMFKDRDGLWWLGMYEGVFTYDEKTGVITDCNAAVGLPKQFSFAVFNIAQDANGIIWITAKNLLIKVDKKSNTSFKTEIFKSDDIKSTLYRLYIDHENRIWIGTYSDGIYRFDPVAKKFISYHYHEIGPYSKINAIAAFCEMSKDSLLIGSVNAGVFLLNPNTGKYAKVVLPNANGMDADFSINSIYKSGDNIWIGTENNGLWQTNARFTQSFNETISDGLPSMAVNSIAGDKHDNIWLLTNSGVVRFQIKEKKITVFDKRDGIQNFGLDAMMVDTNSNVLFASRGAIYNFNPARIIKNESPPKVSITDLRIFDQDYTIHKGEAIELNYNQNYFTFEYVALNYTQSRLNKYAYKMAGLDKKWNYAGSRRYVSYANLDEGTYTFYVKACNNEGVWNNTPAKFTLIIDPPFWHRWWFYASFILVFISSVYFLYWYNVNQLKMRVQLRNKIARDLHDDIGSTLSGINIFSKIALQKLNHNETGSSELLEKISDRSEKTMDALSDIVWSISTKNDRIDNFLVKAREYMAETLEPQGIRYEMHIDEDISSLKLGMEVRKEFYLIFKEAICNASKYAQCTLIKLSLKKEKDMFTLIIRDNGKGFDIDTVTHGNGLENMQHRAEKMNAKLAIVSAENQGTSIILSFHIPRFR